MNNLKLIIVTLILIPTAIISQSCLPEGIAFTTQAQIDNFQINYPGCTEIEGDVIIGPHPGNTDITNLEGLIVLTSIQGSLSIGDCNSWPSGNPNLSSLEGLSNLEYIGGDFICCRNNSLTNLSGLNNLALIGGYLHISNNDNLTTLSGLDNLSSISGLGIGPDPSLQNLNGLEGLTTIFDWVVITHSESLTNLSGLDNITSIGGTFYVDYNESLINFQGMENLNTIGGDFLIGDNGDAIWHGNPSLRNLSGLENLSSVGGSLVIAFSHSLVNLESLEGLNYVGEDLRIYKNQSLTKLAGLEYLHSIGGNIRIENNISLSTCHVQSLCDYLGSPSGTVEILDNSPGCNSQEEVWDSCIVSVPENHYDLASSIYPNPFTESVTIEYNLSESGYVKFKIYNHLGVLVETVLEEQQQKGEYRLIWNAKRLPAGVYFCDLETGYTTQTLKMIKMQ